MLDMYYDSLKLQVRDNTQQVVRSMIVMDDAGVYLRWDFI